MSGLLALAAEPGAPLSLLLVAEGALRWLGYLGLVALVGTTSFTTWVWSEGRRDPTLKRLVLLGWALAVVATVLLLPATNPTAGWAAFAGLEGAAALSRLALLALVPGFAFGLDGWRRPGQYTVLVSAWIVALNLTYVLGSDAWPEPGRVVKVLATTGHLLATTVWLGGLLALAVVLIPQTHREVLDSVVPRFSRLAVASVVTLAVTGIVHALAIAGSWSALATSEYGAVLAVKVLVFGLILVLGNEGRRYAVRLDRGSKQELDPGSSERSIAVFAVAIGAEFTLALVVLALTAVLAHVAARI